MCLLHWRRALIIPGVCACFLPAAAGPEKQGLAGQVTNLQDALKNSLHRYRKFVQNDDEDEEDEDWD